MIAEKYTICGLDLCVTNKNVENSSKKFPYFCIFKLNQHVEKKIAQQLPSIIRPKISHSFFFFFVELLFWLVWRVQGIRLGYFWQTFRAAPAKTYQLNMLVWVYNVYLIDHFTS